MPSKKRSDSKIAEVWFVLALKEKDPRKQGKWSTTLNPAMMWFGKGVAFCELGEYEEAIWCFDKALKINPRYVVTWTGKGYAFYKLRKYEEALKCYDKGLKLNLGGCGSVV